jgi:hypothetical protein
MWAEHVQSAHGATGFHGGQSTELVRGPLSKTVTGLGRVTIQLRMDSKEPDSSYGATVLLGLVTQIQIERQIKAVLRSFLECGSLSCRFFIGFAHHPSPPSDGS